MMTTTTEKASNNSEVINTFNTLHQIPELGFQEFKTAAYLAAKLKQYGFSVQEQIAGTGIVGTLDSGRPGSVVGLRGDMDALAHKIDDKVVAIHSCGHDAHSSMVLAAAEKLAQKGLSQGKLQIIFQPAEELGTGALRMAEAGVGKDIDKLFGIHLRPQQEASLGQISPALYHGASSTMKVTITGKTAHGARPHLGINAINVASAIIQAINALYVDPMVASSIKATQIKGGGPASNAIPASAEVVFDVRSRKNHIMQQLLTEGTALAEKIAAACGAEAEVQIYGLIPAAEYNTEMIELAKKAIVEVVGEQGLIDEIITPGAEDFHYFALQYPHIKTTYLGLGCDLKPGLHDPNMSFNTQALTTGVDVLVTLVEKALVE